MKIQYLEMATGAVATTCQLFEGHNDEQDFVEGLGDEEKPLPPTVNKSLRALPCAVKTMKKGFEFAQKKRAFAKLERVMLKISKGKFLKTLGPGCKIISFNHAMIPLQALPMALTVLTDGGISMNTVKEALKLTFNVVGSALSTLVVETVMPIIGPSVIPTLTAIVETFGLTFADAIVAAILGIAGTAGGSIGGLISVCIGTLIFYGSKMAYSYFKGGKHVEVSLPPGYRYESLTGLRVPYSSDLKKNVHGSQEDGECSIPPKSQQSVLPLKSQQSALPLKSQQNVLPLKSQQSALPLKSEQTVLLPLKSKQRVLPLKSEQTVLPLKREQRISIPLKSKQNAPDKNK